MSLLRLIDEAAHAQSVCRTEVSTILCEEELFEVRCAEEPRMVLGYEYVQVRMGTWIVSLN